MALDEEKSKKLRALLGALPPGMRATLSRMVGEARNSGINDPTFDLLAEFLADPGTGSTAEEPPPTPDKIFQTALEPFLIPQVLQRKIPGRICIASLAPIWSWIESDLAKAAIAAYSTNETSPQAEREEVLLAAIARTMGETVTATKTNPDNRRRIAGQVGGERNFEEFEDVAVVLRRSRELGRISSILTDADPANEAILAATLARTIVDLARLDPRLPYHVAVMTQRVLGSTVKLAKLAVIGTGSEDLKLIAASPFAALIEISLAETERSAALVGDGLKQLKSDGTLAPALRDFAMSSRNLRAVLNLDQTTHDWAKRLTEMRTRLSEAIARELNGLPRLIRACVKTLRAFDQRRLGMPDPVDIERTCLLIELLNAAKLSSTELGVNETLLRVFNDTDTYLDHTSRILVEDARNAIGDQRNTVRAFGDAAIRMTEMLHGHTRATALRRSFGTAAGPNEPVLRVAK
ncbi:hypothetical protein [Candidatus Raskinella chloraquaticus]